MQHQNEKKTVKKPSPEQSQQDMQKTGKGQADKKQQADKKVTGQQKNKDQQQGNKNPGKTDPDMQEYMGSGKRQDDN